MNAIYPRPRRPKRPSVADNSLLRRAFVSECGLGSASLDDYPELHGSYRAWLGVHHIDPDTGRMTDAGLAFFKSLLDEDRARKARRRRAA